MKLTKLFSKLWLSAAALLAFSACSNEDLPTQTTSEAQKTKKVRVEFTATKDNDNLRAVFGVDTSNDLGQLTDLKMPEKDVILRIGVRQGTGDVLVQDIQFKKFLGKNYATYAGDITVPVNGTGKYKIAALLLKEVNGTSFLTPTKEATTPQTMTIQEAFVTREGDVANQLLLPAADNTLTVNVPYITKWQDLEVNGSVAQSTTLYLEPQGTVLRMRIRNEAASARTFHKVKLVTSAFVVGGTYQILEERDGYPAWYTSNSETFELTIPNGVEVAGNSALSKWLYLWVMPRKMELVEGRFTSASLSLTATPTAQNAYRSAFETRELLTTGSVPMTLVYTEGHDAVIGTLPESGEEFGQTITTPRVSLEYFSEYAINKAGDGFVSGTAFNNPDLGYFSLEERKTLFPKTIGGTVWRVPTRAEFASVFPYSLDLTGYGDYKLRRSSTTLDVLEGPIKIGSITQNYYNDYKIEANGMSYAIRFKNKSNKWRTAFRYRVVGNLANGDARLRVEAIYLGNANIVLSDVANPQFWIDRESSIIAREFPFYGSSHAFNGVGAQGRNAILGTATLYDETAIHAAYLNRSGQYGVTGAASMLQSTAVFPIKDL